MDLISAAEVIRRIEKQTGQKICVDKKLDATVTLEVKNAALTNVLNQLAEQVGARAKPNGSHYRMLPVWPREYLPGCGQTERPCGLAPTGTRAINRPVRVLIAYTSEL